MKKLKTVSLFNSFLLSSVIFYTCSVNSQSLIINEFSNGPSGTQEYVEFIALDTGSNNNCAPCIDIRGWIIDDNNGYHGSAGIAGGCNRFSNDAFWSCIPLGTMITIYNGTDPNIDIPADDIDINDGNCKLVISIENTTLFESNLNTPSPVICDYPIAGWTAGGNWSRMGMRNGGDCLRLVDLTGCEVFSLSYGDISLNSTIYFPGSGTDDVFYFSGTNPYNQADWLQGCAGDPGACLGNDQTPGAPNSNLNDAYISQFTINGCQPITPLIVVISSTDVICSNNGTALASPSGGAGSYTFNWLDEALTPIGQSTANATNLTAGVYFCVVSTSIGCIDTSAISVLPSSSSPTLSISNQSNSCGSCEGAITLNASSGSGPYTYSINPAVSIPTNPTSSPLVLNDLCADIYSVTITDDLGCQDDLDFTIINEGAPTISTTSNLNICNGESVELSAVIGGSASDISWISPNGSFSDPNALTTTFTPSVSDAIAFVVATALSPNCGNVQQNVFINVSAPLDPSFAQIPDQCDGAIFSLNTTSLNGIEGVWSPSIDNTNTTIYNFTPNLGECANSQNMTVVIHQNTSSTTDLTICDDALPFVWNGLSFISAGSQNTTLSSLNTGCDSLVTLNLSVNPTSSSISNLTICDSDLPFTWNGLSFNSSGSQNTTLPSFNSGCDSLVTLNLSVNPTTSSSSNLTICESELPFSWNGLTFNATESQSTSLSSVLNGCDSLVTLNLVVNNSSASITNTSICDNELPYAWNGITFNVAGSQSTNLSSVITGCDSLVTLNLIVNTASSSTAVLTICDSELPYSWNGLTFNTAGIQNTTIPSLLNGCDSIITLNLSVNPSTTPIFDPILPICIGDALSLPGLSTNSIDGSWSPAVNNTITTNYTFTPTVGQCATAQNLIVSVNNLPVFTSVLGSNPSICGGVDGSIVLNGLIAFSAYELTYNDGTSNIGPLSITTDASGNYILSSIIAGSYSSFTISDANCSYTVVPSVTLVDPSAPVFTANSIGDPTTCLGNDGAINLTGLIANTTYTLTYLDNGVSVGPVNITSDGSGNIQLNSLDAGTYSSFVMNLAGCTGSIGSTISLIDPVSPILQTTDPTAVCSPLTVDLTVAGVTLGSTGGGILTYWTDAAATTSLTGPTTLSTSGMYYIQSESNGCTDIESVNVTINETPVLQITDPTAVCSPSTVDLSAAGVTSGSTGGGTLTYWTDAAATISLSNPAVLSTSGMYYIQSDSNGCTDIESVNVVVNPTPSFSASGTDPTVCNASDGLITISGLDPLTNYTLTYDSLSTATQVAIITTDAVGEFTLIGFEAGLYNAFSITLNTCSFTSTENIDLNNP
ncbi:MAG: hypothetical protein QNL43_07440, partial [Crocinitomicaceae bacterium]